MITISLGNVGSGKTASIVREMYLNKSNRLTYTNIQTKGLKNVKLINADMIIHKEVIGEKKKKDGSTEIQYKKTLNKEFWMNIDEPINVIIDEASQIINSRRFMSKTNEIMAQFLALIRRVLGSSDSGFGELTFIDQLYRKIDVNARDMATNVKYHICHFVKGCNGCGAKWQENSEIPKQLYQCPFCSSWKVIKFNHQIEVWEFANMNNFISWKEYGMNTFFEHYIIPDIEKIFKNYNTLQWDNLFEDHY